MRENVDASYADASLCECILKSIKKTKSQSSHFVPSYHLSHVVNYYNVALPIIRWIIRTLITSMYITKADYFLCIALNSERGNQTEHRLAFLGDDECRQLQIGSEERLEMRKNKVTGKGRKRQERKKEKAVQAPRKFSSRQRAEKH